MLRILFATLFWCALAFAAFLEAPKHELTIAIVLGCILLYVWLVAPLWRAGKKLLVLALTLPLVLLHLDTFKKLAHQVSDWLS